MSTEAIILPPADDLDTGASSEWKVDLYLVPAAESVSGKPEVTTHGGVGNIGTPMPAWNRRWASIGSYGGLTQGTGVLSVLKELDAALVAVSDAYCGSEWDGSNMVGQWPEDHNYDGAGAELAESWLQAVDSGLPGYWDAGDWFGHAGEGWGELCETYNIDAHRALGTAEERATVVEELRTAIRAEGTDEPVIGLGDYLSSCAGEWEPSE